MAAEPDGLGAGAEAVGLGGGVVVAEGFAEGAGGAEAVGRAEAVGTVPGGRGGCGRGIEGAALAEGATEDEADGSAEPLGSSDGIGSADSTVSVDVVVAVGSAVGLSGLVVALFSSDSLSGLPGWVAAARFCWLEA